MKKSVRIAKIFVTFALIAATVAAPLCTLAAGFTPSSTTQLANGVTLQTQVTTDNSFITAGQRINLVTVDLSQPNITMEMVLNKSSSYTLRSVKTVMSEYNTSMSSTKRPLVGINADWFHTIGSDLYSEATTSYYLPFGCDILDGEILCSNYSYAEWAYAGAIPPMVFGITSDNKAIVGQPRITPTIKNITKGSTVKADGLNRAPVQNSVMVYNNALRTTYGANADSIEIEIEVTSGSNRFYTSGTTVTGKIVRISKSGTAKNTTLSNGNIVITARYDADDYNNMTNFHSNGIAVYDAYKGVHPISTVKSNYTKISNYSVGDTIEITTEITDTEGYSGATTSAWKKCQYSAGGNFCILKNGQGINESALASESYYYPTCMIGTDKDGKVLIANCTYDASNGVRQGCKMNELTKFAKALGFYNCFLFDGGGSATLITATSASNGTLVDRGTYSDGAIRSVFNSFVVFYDTNKVTVTATPKATATPKVTAKVTATPKVTAKVTATPTEKATTKPRRTVTPTETPVVTEAPAVTETPIVTEAPIEVTEEPISEVTATPETETEDTGDKTVKGPNWILIGAIIAAIVAFLAVDVVIIIKKFKK